MNPNNTEVKLIQDKTFHVICSAVNKLADFVKPTYGPAGNKVIISKILYNMVVDDGVSAARDFEVPDVAEQAVVKVIREVAIRTSDRAGDGTTGATIMLQALMNEIQRKSNRNGRKIAEELKKGFEELRDHLKKTARPIETKEDLKKVAKISFDNEQVAEMIADIYFKLGKDAVVTVEKHQGMDIVSKVNEGLSFDRGYISPYMANNERLECELDNPLVLVTDYRITEINDIIPIMNLMVSKEKRKLVIIADNVESHALSTLIVNKLQGKFESVAITAPQSADRTVTLEDIATLLGAKMFSSAKGDKLQNAKIEDLGSCEHITVRRNETLISEPKGDKGTIAMAITSLRASIESENDEHVKRTLEKRLGMYTQSIASIKVGAPTENEQKALKLKIENAVKATQSAYRGGVVCGSGLALARTQTSSPLLNLALQYPYRQVCENMGIEPIHYMASDSSSEGKLATNLVTGETGDFLAVGVADPVDVLIAGVESAVSIATILVTSHAMIVEEIKKPPME